MRIVSGELGGRTFESPSGNRTHPMSEKIRNALFNALGDVTGLSVLDAFAGSGALSFEAISRGAKAVTALDVDKNALNKINANIQLLGLGNEIKPIRANNSSWSDNNPKVRFDVVMCDPPYDGIRYDLLGKMAEHTKKKGIVVLSLPPDSGFLLPPENYRELSAKSYGDAKLVFYRKLTD